MGSGGNTSVYIILSKLYIFAPAVYASVAGIENLTRKKIVGFIVTIAASLCITFGGHADKEVQGAAISLIGLLFLISTIALWSLGAVNRPKFLNTHSFMQVIAISTLADILLCVVLWGVFAITTDFQTSSVDVTQIVFLSLLTGYAYLSPLFISRGFTLGASKGSTSALVSTSAIIPLLLMTFIYGVSLGALQWIGVLCALGTAPLLT